MRRFPRFVRLCAAVSAIFVLAGCGDRAPHANPLMLKGDRYRREGDPALAGQFYRRYLEKHPASAAGHLAMATLCDESLGDPLRALYHYDEYLRLTPEEETDRAAVIRFRELARARLRDELNASAPARDEAAEEEIRRLNVRIASLKRYIFEQQRKIAALEQRNGAPPANPEPPAETESPPAPAADGMRFYTVRAGDTPARISQKFYGTSQKYRLIMEANQLRSAASLRIGQVLTIPAETP